MSTENRMIDMIDSFELKKNSEIGLEKNSGIGLENTDLFRYFKSGGEMYQLIKRVNDLCQKDIRPLVEELRKLLSNGRYSYGFTHSDKYCTILNEGFKEKFRSELSRAGTKKVTLASVLKKGLPGISENKILSFLEANRADLVQALKDAAVIALACDAASHRDRYNTDRLKRISEASDKDNGAMTVSKEAAELLMNRLRTKQVSSNDKKLMITIESSQLYAMSFVIVGDLWVKRENGKTICGNDHPASDSHFHFAYMECELVDESGAIVTSLSCPKGDSYNETHDEYLYNLAAKSDVKYPALEGINDDGNLDVFNRILVSRNEETTAGMPTSKPDDSASYVERI